MPTLWEAFSLFLRDHGVGFAASAAFLSLTTAASLFAWWHTRNKLRAAQEWLLHNAIDRNQLLPRLNAIEGAVDTLAIGVERLTETELFAARLMVEKRKNDADALEAISQTGVRG